MSTPQTAQAIRFERKTGGDQVVGSAEETITFDSPDVGDGFFCPGADGVKDFFVLYQILVNIASGATVHHTSRVLVGATGAIGDTLLWQGQVQAPAAGGGLNRRISSFVVRIPAPGASDVVTLTGQPTALTQSRVLGGTAPASYSSLLIWEA